MFHPLVVRYLERVVRTRRRARRCWAWRASRPACTGRSGRSRGRWARGSRGACVACAPPAEGGRFRRRTARNELRRQFSHFTVHTITNQVRGFVYTLLCSGPFRIPMFIGSSIVHSNLKINTYMEWCENFTI